MAAARVTGHVLLKDRKRGPVYYMKYRLADGRQAMKLLGPAWTQRTPAPAGYYTKKTADQELQSVLVKAREGTLPDSQKRSGRTFGDACTEWLRYVKDERQCAPSTVADYRNVANAMLAEFGRDTPLEKITTERIEKWREELLEGQLSRRTVQKMLVLLHGVMKRAKRKWKLQDNPAENVERVKVERSGDFNKLSPVEVAAVARAAGNAQDAAIFTVAAFTGLRLGELRALRWRDIDFATSNVHVRVNYTHGQARRPKSGKVRSVPLIDQASIALDGLSKREHFTEPDDLVFCSLTGEHLNDAAIRGAFYDALDAAGLGDQRTKTDPIVFHDLRHSFGTMAVEVWALHDVQAYMGHADIATTMLYIHHTPKTAAAAELTRLVAAALSPSTAPSTEPSTELPDLTATERN